MTIIDCAAMIEPHWRWESCPFVSQTYHEGDEFQEFGLKWYGTGFSQVSAPGWRNRGAAKLDDYSLEDFVGVATVADFSGEREIGSGALRAKVGRSRGRRLLIVKTGHADRISNRRAGYWRKAPVLDPEVADAAKDLGYLHIAVDLPCDRVEARRPGGGVRSRTRTSPSAGASTSAGCCSPRTARTWAPSGRTRCSSPRFRSRFRGRPPARAGRSRSPAGLPTGPSSTTSRRRSSTTGAGSSTCTRAGASRAATSPTRSTTSSADTASPTATRRATCTRTGRPSTSCPTAGSTSSFATPPSSTSPTSTCRSRSPAG